MKKETVERLSILIGIAFMLLFWLLPFKSAYITPLGFKVIGVFLGTIIMWSVGYMIWPSILSVALLGWYGYEEMGPLLKNWLGNPIVVMIFFLLILLGAFQAYGCTKYVARFFLTRKVMEGKPYVFTLVMLLGTYLMAAFVNPWAGVFLFLPIVQNVCQILGYQKTDLYTKLMTILVVMVALIGFPTSYFNGTILGLNANYTQISGDLISGGAYMTITMTVSVLIILMMVLVMKYLIKPDVSKMYHLTIDKINQEDLPPMNAPQKVTSLAVLIFILAMFTPILLPNWSLSQLLKQNISGIAMTIVAVLAMIQLKEGPVIEVQTILQKNFSWPTFFIIASSLMLGEALTSPQVGFTEFLKQNLTPLFTEMSYLSFALAIIVAGVLISNVLNSVVITLILQPIIYTYSVVSGANVIPIVILMTYATIGFAAVTPSASPYAAAIFAQKDFVTAKDVYRYTSLFVLGEILIIILVGIPLAQFLF